MSSDDSSKKDFSKEENKNLQTIISKMSNDYSYQKNFIKLLVMSIKSSASGNKEDIITLENIQNMLPSIIQELGIPFCDLINDNQDILDYFCDMLIKNKSEKAKIILMNFINVFNYQSIELNPSDDLIERLEEYDIDTFKEMENNKRLYKTEIESLYDGLSELFSTWRISINIQDNLENDFFLQFQNALKEKKEIINEIERKNKYPKSTIDFFKEKIKNYELNINNLNNNNCKANTFEKQLENNYLSTPDPKINNNNYNTNPNNYNPKINNNLNNINISNFNSLNNDKKNDLNQNINDIDLDLDIDEILKKLREIPLKNRTSFYKDEILVKGEDELTEFKNYLFPLNEKQGEELKRQFCGFLNSQGGRLYLGINDDKIVKGVVLNYKRCDALRNLLVNYTYDFYPKCRLDKIKVYFIPIRSMKDNKFINNLYVVKIIVLKGEPNILYSMTNKGFNSAIRLQGQCANLSAEEIYKEIIKRGAIKNNYINLENEFKDPEPEINFDVDQDNEIDDDWIIKDKKKKKKKKDHDKIKQKNKRIKMNKRDIFVVEVKNIDNNLKVKDIYDFFNGCGSLSQKFFEKDGKSRGYGILKFSSENLAKSAIDKYNQIKLGETNLILILKKKEWLSLYE